VPGELRWLAKQIRQFVPLHVASFVCMTVGSLLALLTPLVLKWLIDHVLPQRETGLLLLAALLIFLSYQGRTALTSFGNYLTLTAAQKIALRLRMEILRHLDRLSADYYESTPPGAAMYPLKEPIEEVAYFGSDLLPGADVCHPPPDSSFPRRAAALSRQTLYRFRFGSNEAGGMERFP
jgi:ABC-type bacteriocin/lantibiotic exporter with double-glycine peptidase domain